MSIEEVRGRLNSAILPELDKALSLIGEETKRPGQYTPV